MHFGLVKYLINPSGKLYTDSLQFNYCTLDIFHLCYKHSLGLRVKTWYKNHTRKPI